MLTTYFLLQSEYTMYANTGVSQDNVETQHLR